MNIHVVVTDKHIHITAFFHFFKKEQYFELSTPVRYNIPIVF